MSHRVVAVLTDTLEEGRSVAEICRSIDGERVDLRLVVPAVEANRFHQVTSDLDEPRRRASERLELSLRYLRENGVQAQGAVGDPDPVQAARDALLLEQADEVVFVESRSGRRRWFESGLFEHAKQSLEPPLRMVVLDSSSAEQVVEIETAGPGRIPVVEHEVGAAYVPGLSRIDVLGISAGIFGTAIAAILAAIAAGGTEAASGWVAAAILIAIGIALINLAQVIGLTLMEAVSYRRGVARFFRMAAMTLTPLAILVNLGIVLFA